jgi:protein phosphatase
MPVTAFLAVADNAFDATDGENPARRALDLLQGLIQPPVIAEEELDRPHMETLIRDAFSEVNRGLAEYAVQKNLGDTVAVSLTVAITDKQKAYIGHVGSGRVYLLHDERLYDLTPAGELNLPVPAEPRPQPQPEETPTLFEVPGAPPVEAGAGPQAQAVVAEAAPGGVLLGQAGEPAVVYNEVEIVPGDVIVLCTNGLWEHVKEEEIVESLLSSLNMERSANQLNRLAFNRDASDNATIVNWQYTAPGFVAAGREREARSVERKTGAVDALVVALLCLVLIGIFAVGFAFGWRITDAFRKPQKQAAQAKREETARKAEEQRKKKEEEARAKQSTPSQQPAVERIALVNGDGVRMRTTPDVHAAIVGLMRDGQTVSIISESAGTDGKMWTKARATVISQGKDTVAEGYIRSDFLIPAPGQQTPAATTPGTVPATAPAQ